MSRNDERFSKSNKRYFTLNYDNLTETNLKDVVAGFERAKLPVASVVSSNRARKVNGEGQKNVQIVFENGQSVTMAVGEGGNVVGTKLNARVIPVNNQSTISAYTKEVAQAVTANIPRYSKVLERKAKAAIKDVSNVKPASRTITARIAEAKSTLEQAQENLRAATQEQAEVGAQSLEFETSTNDYRSQIAELRREEDELMKKIAELGGQA